VKRVVEIARMSWAGLHTLADTLHSAVSEGRLPGPGDIRWLT
jgi:hypothetical protein